MSDDAPADAPDDAPADAPADALELEFDTVAGWTADAVAELGPEVALPAACRGSGNPDGLRWLAQHLGLRAGTRLLDSGAGLGGAAELAARELAVRPTLVDPMPAACRAASRLFGRAVGVAAGERLPFSDGTFDVAWCLGVLCTVADKEPVLAELRRVVHPGGAVGLLVYCRTRTPVPDQPEGNHFPTVEETLRLLERVGLRVGDRATLAEFADPPAHWQRAAEAVEDVVARDHREDPRWQVAQEQQQAMGRLIGEGLVLGELLVARR